MNQVNLFTWRMYASASTQNLVLFLIFMYFLNLFNNICFLFYDISGLGVLYNVLLKLVWGKDFFFKKVYILEIKITEFLCKFQVRVTDFTSEVLLLIFPLKQRASRSIFFPSFSKQNKRNEKRGTEGRRYNTDSG